MLFYNRTRKIWFQPFYPYFFKATLSLSCSCSNIFVFIPLILSINLRMPSDLCIFSFFYKWEKWLHSLHLSLAWASSNVGLNLRPLFIWNSSYKKAFRVYYYIKYGCNKKLFYFPAYMVYLPYLTLVRKGEWFEKIASYLYWKSK